MLSLHYISHEPGPNFETSLTIVSFCATKALFLWPKLTFIITLHWHLANRIELDRAWVLAPKPGLNAGPALHKPKLDDAQAHCAPGFLEARAWLRRMSKIWAMTQGLIASYKSPTASKHHRPWVKSWEALTSFKSPGPNYGKPYPDIRTHSLKI